MGKAPVYVRSFENGFARTVQVRFGDCDPAGIVFYPRYVEMFNNLVEDWCAQGLGLSFYEMIQVRGLGLPTVSLATDFIAPSRLGEELRAELSVRDVGGAKIMLAIRLSGADGSERVAATVILVLTDLRAGCAKRIPDAMRVSIERFRPPRQL